MSVELMPSLPTTFWCRRQLLITLTGPDGRAREVRIPKPYARIGGHADCEIVLPDKDLPERCCYLHATEDGIFCYGLTEENSLWRVPTGWMSSRAVLRIGQTALRARFADTLSVSKPDEADLRVSRGDDRQAPRLVIASDDASFAPTERLCHSPLTLIGRRKPSNLRLKHETVSRIHCMLYRSPLRLWVVDLLSSNGTYVDGQPVECSSLEPGQTVQLGVARITIRPSRLVEEHEAKAAGLEAAAAQPTAEPLVEAPAEAPAEPPVEPLDEEPAELAHSAAEEFAESPSVWFDEPPASPGPPLELAAADDTLPPDLGIADEPSSMAELDLAELEPDFSAPEVEEAAAPPMDVAPDVGEPEMPSVAEEPQPAEAAQRQPAGIASPSEGPLEQLRARLAEAETRLARQTEEADRDLEELRLQAELRERDLAQQALTTEELLAGKQAKLANVESQLALLSKELDTRTKEHEAETHALQSEMQAAQDQQRLLADRLQSLERQLEESRQQHAELADKLSQSQSATANAQKELELAREAEQAALVQRLAEREGALGDELAKLTAERTAESIAAAAAIARLNDELAEARNRTQAAESSHEELRRQNDELRGSLLKLTEEADQLRQRRIKQDEELAAAEERHQTVQVELERFKVELADAAGKLEASQRQRQELVEQSNQQKAAAEALRQESAALAAQLTENAAIQGEQQDTLASETQRHMARVTSLEEELKQQRLQYQQQRFERESLSELLAAAQGELAAAQRTLITTAETAEQLAAARQELAAASSENQTLKGQLEQRKQQQTEVAAIQAELSEARRRLQDLAEQAEQKQALLETVQQERERYASEVTGLERRNEELQRQVESLEAQTRELTRPDVAEETVDFGQEESPEQGQGIGGDSAGEDFFQAAVAEELFNGEQPSDELAVEATPEVPLFAEETDAAASDDLEFEPEEAEEEEEPLSEPPRPFVPVRTAAAGGETDFLDRLLTHQYKHSHAMRRRRMVGIVVAIVVLLLAVAGGWFFAGDMLLRLLTSP